MFNTAWEWIKKAPLPVVLALTLPMGAWVLYTQDALHAEQMSQKAEMKALKQVRDEKDRDLQEKLDKANDKLDRILEAMLVVKAQLEAHEKASETRAKKADK